jgi:hypothetical protein
MWSSIEMSLTPDTPTTGESDPVVAYCAPGLKEYATRLLDSRSEQYREVVEHPWMEGRTDVILAVDWSPAGIPLQWPGRQG